MSIHSNQHGDIRNVSSVRARYNGILRDISVIRVRIGGVIRTVWRKVKAVKGYIFTKNNRPIATKSGRLIKTRRKQ